MPLSNGTRLGPYQILSPIGAGGMGQVYRARDTRLNRDVAIKVLSQETASDPQFRRRFQREAHAIAALNHPHICTLHDVGQQDGLDFLVMEHLEGDTLASRLVNGPMPLASLVTTATQIADALAKAHRAGITHRDLKPANIMLTRAGVKLLDFGLAVERHGGDEGTTAASTMTALTARGDLLGTLQYMAPELLEGRPADVRSDIFAFGCVLYEMATGRRAFDGTNQAAIIAAILKAEPPSPAALQPGLPMLLERLIVSCLAKDQEERSQSMVDVKRELHWISDLESVAVKAPRSQTMARAAGWVLLGAALAAVGAVWVGQKGQPPVARTPGPLPARFALAVDDGWEVQGRPAISPDGSRIAYAARPSKEPGKPQLFVRTVDSVAPVALDGTVGGEWPFFSPDGQQIGFFHSGGLSTIPAAGGVPILISSTGHLASDASWSRADDVIFAPTVFSGLRRVAIKGGPIETVTRPDSTHGEVGHMFPEMLPGDAAVLLTITNADSVESSKIAAYDFRTGRTRVLVEGGSQGRFAAPDHLVYARGATLMAVPFDVRTLDVRGRPVGVQDGVRHGGASYFAISASGTLVYTEGADETPLSTPMWTTRDGNAVALANAVVGEYFDPKISPDGRQIAFSIRVGHNQDIWVHDIARGTWARLTQDPATDMAPVWIAGGSRIVYSSRSGDSVDLFSVPSDGSGEPAVLFRSPGWKFASSWSEAQKMLAFQESPRGVLGAVGSDIGLLDVSNTPSATPFVHTRFSEGSLDISPDGRWGAYASDESGRREVYVRPLSGPARKWQISTDGGQHPCWSPAGDELFYVSGNRVMSVKVASGREFGAGVPQPVINVNYYGGVSVPNYDIARDGRLLMMRGVDPLPPARRLIVVQDWTRELSRRAPPG